MSGTRANLEHIAMTKVDLGPLYSASTDGHDNPEPKLNPAKKEKVFCNPCTQDRVVAHLEEHYTLRLEKSSHTAFLTPLQTEN